MKLSIVIPFYNEAENVANVIKDVQREMVGINHEIIVVDNGSRDLTARELAQFFRRNSAIELVTVPVNRGLGHGIRAGLAVATGDILGWHWGDGQIPARAIRDAYDALVEQASCLSGVQAIRTTRADGPLRKLQSRICNFLFRVGFGVRSPDINGSPKLFTRAALEKIRPQSDGWFIDAGVMLRAHELGLRIGRVPTTGMARRNGHSKIRWSSTLEFLREMIFWQPVEEQASSLFIGERQETEELANLRAELAASKRRCPCCGEDYVARELLELRRDNDHLRNQDRPNSTLQRSNALTLQRQ